MNPLELQWRACAPGLRLSGDQALRCFMQSGNPFIDSHATFALRSSDPAPSMLHVIAKQDSESPRTG